jgi:DNA-binding MarR family transcriptional regulator
MLESISDNLQLFFPLYYKKLMKGGHKLPGKRASYVEVPILNILMNRGPLPISEIGRRLRISKPNMTTIIDKLIRGGKVRRMPDKKDRRVIRIEVTESGGRFMKEHKRQVKEQIKRNLMGLKGRDLRVLCESLDHVRLIVSKISDEE